MRACGYMYWERQEMEKRGIGRVVLEKNKEWVFVTVKLGFPFVLLFRLYYGFDLILTIRKCWCVIVWLKERTKESLERSVQVIEKAQEPEELGGENNSDTRQGATMYGYPAKRICV